MQKRYDQAVDVTRSRAPTVESDVKPQLWQAVILGGSGALTIIGIVAAWQLRNVVPLLVGAFFAWVGVIFMWRMGANDRERRGVPVVRAPEPAPFPEQVRVIPVHDWAAKATVIPRPDLFKMFVGGVLAGRSTAVRGWYPIMESWGVPNNEAAGMIGAWRDALMSRGLARWKGRGENAGWEMLTPATEEDVMYELGID